MGPGKFPTEGRTRFAPAEVMVRSGGLLFRADVSLSLPAVISTALEKYCILPSHKIVHKYQMGFLKTKCAGQQSDVCLFEKTRLQFGSFTYALRANIHRDVQR